MKDVHERIPDVTLKASPSTGQAIINGASGLPLLERHDEARAIEHNSESALPVPPG
ncbi:hypothetical protein RESH_04030 [Rhodopirellula europaea SH398]|uniref:Uncharacterized protein n=1 Tax=Rhodopirellula europaea SH398 TaxID=1263868 RepID=M5SCM1_9BACT|nr:hypothetical protein RESH_04030 [Rhodopirellula europaea SH398]